MAKIPAKAIGWLKISPNLKTSPMKWRDFGEFWDFMREVATSPMKPVKWPNFCLLHFLKIEVRFSHWKSQKNSKNQRIILDILLNLVDNWWFLGNILLELANLTASSVRLLLPREVAVFLQNSGRFCHITAELATSLVMLQKTPIFGHLIDDIAKKRQNRGTSPMMLQKTAIFGYFIDDIAKNRPFLATSPMMLQKNGHFWAFLGTSS